MELLIKSYLNKFEMPNQLLKYALIGILSNTFGYFMYIIITYLGIGPKTGASILYPLGVAIGYFGNRRWTFKYTGTFVESSVKFCFIHLSGFLINITILSLFVDIIGYPHQIVQGCSIILVALYLFLASKFFVFKKKMTLLSLLCSISITW